MNQPTHRRSAWAAPLVACMAVALLAQPLAAARTGDLSEALRHAANQAAPSVVTIETVGGTQPRRESPGAAFIVAEGPTTGLIWSADGLILTSAFNFVRDPSVITVVLSDGRRFVAELIARDQIRRLAMLRIDATGLPVPQWADIDEVKVGQWALSLGHGFGKLPLDGEPIAGGCTITAGIISGLGRMSGLVVQTDAKLSPANFGGPLVDLDGRIIGICVPFGLETGQLTGVEWYDSGIGFAVPRRQIDVAADELARGRNLRPGLLGIGLARHPSAIIVAGCGDPSPALRAGIQPGDQLLAIDDQPVSSFAQLKRVLRPRSAGSRVIVHVRRDGQEIELPLTLATSEDIGPVTAPEAPPQPGSQPQSEPADRFDLPPAPWDEGPAIVPPSTGPS